MYPARNIKIPEQITWVSALYHVKVIDKYKNENLLMRHTGNVSWIIGQLMIRYIKSNNCSHLIMYTPIKKMKIFTIFDRIVMLQYKKYGIICI
ncbi:hypothetical protein Ctaglu_47010 [Clostridium tagluense]|uniref:Uncharacterized protein n=1 Tax=Clostridium tagluense TaxID=360422 RepID=A0A401UUF5_9CLOT|nr:hypothetical protein Ctaglu_47010 [Clostridium tagluense]